MIEKTTNNSRLPVSRISPEVLEVIILRLLETIGAASPHGTAGCLVFCLYIATGTRLQSIPRTCERWPTFPERSKRGRRRRWGNVPESHVASTERYTLPTRTLGCPRAGPSRNTLQPETPPCRTSRHFPDSDHHPGPLLAEALPQTRWA